MSTRVGWNTIVVLALAACDPPPPAVQGPTVALELAGEHAESVVSIVWGSEPAAPVRRRVETILEAEIRDRAAERVPAGFATFGEARPNASLRAELGARGGGEVVELTATFPSSELPSIDGLARISVLERAERILRRQDAVSEAMSGAQSEARELGATAATPIWLTNSLQLSLPVSAAVSFMRLHPEAEYSLNRPVAPEWTGSQARLQTGASRLVNAGFHGDPPGVGRYRIGIIESQAISPNWPSAQPHPVFRESGTDPTTRISLVEDCNTCTAEFLGICFQWGCRPTSNRSTTTGHGDIVTWVAAGSIEEGQDPSVTNASARAERSGIARETVIDYYGANDCDAVTRAVQRAVARGVDVVNMSLRADFINESTSSCDAAYNCGGLNEAIRAATDAGVVVVKSAGNFGETDPDCGITYPAWRPEVIAVGSLRTLGGSGTLATVPVDATSSRGGVGIRYAGAGFDRTAAGLALVAPGFWECFATGASGYSCLTTASGTSFAAPAVSGAVALFAHVLSPSGNIANARDVLVNALLMGDRGNTVGLSTTEGLGRMRVFAPTSSVLTAPWGWGTHRVTAAAGTLTTFTVWDAGPESPGVREWRWAAASFENDLRNLQTDYTLSVADACDPVHGRVIVKSDLSFDPRKRIELSQSEVCPAGRPTCRCLEMEVRIFAAPPGGARIHMADYFHGGNPSAF